MGVARSNTMVYHPWLDFRNKNIQYNREKNLFSLFFLKEVITIKVLDRVKLLDWLTKRKNALYNQVVRDFGSGLDGRVYEHSEVKYWQEAVERGEFDSRIPRIYVILSQTQPEIVDFTFYTDIELVSERIKYLNKLAKRREYWYITLYNNLKDSE